ncbi:tumor necrosis factor receptor superfamily member 10B-like isoform X4 [Manacus candei]|uniref:tumor necrosis factor receptor superfamily member 10B-like isoform X4 n=1 Tax=Manacus candei TaxID=415023 RepID=UPI002227DC7A|nr:tumor necrosis factor receptor superfamily member 10B-like isoform X4 [Manacus candei]
MFCPPRRLCLFLLLLLARAAFGTDAAALSRRDDLDPLDPSGGGTELYYVPEKGLHCQQCPAGTHLAKSCEEENGSSTCLPCKAEEFMDYPNAFHSCHECLKCREDQVELSPCQATRNTECACKKGTFCDPKLPCEMCHKCQTRCPEGQVVLSPCTPYSDLQCGPAQGTGFNYLWIIILVVILILLVLVLLIWKRRNLTSYSLKEMLPIAPSPRPRPRRDLVPQKGKEPIQALRSTFYIFAGMKFIYWKKFGRSLNMLENDLPFDRSQDAFYEMLNKWLEREGSKASVNVLLETLDQLDLRGVADDISSEIIRKGLFKPEGAEEQGGSCDP